MSRGYGEAHHWAKLTDHDVELACELHEVHGLSLAEVARKFDVQRQCIWKIVHGYRRGRVSADARGRRRVRA